MRKHTVLMALALAFSLIILTQLVTTHVRANIITADVNIDPDSLLLMKEETDHGRWMTTYIGLPEDYNVTDIIVSSVTLWVLGRPFEVAMQGDRLMYDIQGNKLMVKFDRAMVTSWLWSMIDHMSLQIKEKRPLELEVTGKLYDDTTFQGKDTITVFFTQT